MKGTVKWFNTKKGYGFIQPEGGNKDVFVHVTALEKTGLRRLFDGQVVSFDIYDDRGRNAFCAIIPNLRKKRFILVQWVAGRGFICFWREITILKIFCR